MLGFSFSLLFYRILYTGSEFFIFLTWNLFLAYVPYAISSILLKVKVKKWYILIVPFMLWLLFIPNAPYIITDFLHLEQRKAVPIWFDLMLILSFAMNGLLFWILSMSQIMEVLKDKFSNRITGLFIHFFIVASAIGVYIGRYGRWNSWDIFTNPLEIINQLMYMIFHPHRFPGFYGMTIIFSVFLFLVFTSAKTTKSKSIQFKVH